MTAVKFIDVTNRSVPIRPVCGIFHRIYWKTIKKLNRYTGNGLNPQCGTKLDLVPNDFNINLNYITTYIENWMT